MPVVFAKSFYKNYCTFPPKVSTSPKRSVPMFQIYEIPLNIESLVLACEWSSFLLNYFRVNSRVKITYIDCIYLWCLDFDIRINSTSCHWGLEKFSCLESPFLLFPVSPASLSQPQITIDYIKTASQIVTDWLLLLLWWNRWIHAVDLWPFLLSGECFWGFFFFFKQLCTVIVIDWLIFLRKGLIL